MSCYIVAIVICATHFTCLNAEITKLEFSIDENQSELKYLAELGGLYKVSRSTNLIDWSDLGLLTRGNNKKVTILDPLQNSPSFYRLDFTPPPTFNIQSISTFCAVGDSITDRNTFNLHSSYNGLGFDQSGWGAILELLSNGKIRSVARSNAFRTDRDHGYSGITSWMYLYGGGWLPSGLIPVNDAMASNPDCFIVHIGSNDIASSTATEVVTRVKGIWDRLVQTGKPVIGTDILQRCASYPGWTKQYRDRVDEVNNFLRSSWQSHGLCSYRYWDDFIEKDANGFAIAAEFPNDGIHPTMRVGLKLGKDLHLLLDNYYNGQANLVPSLVSNDWLTPNPAMAGSGSLAQSWTPLSLGVSNTDVIYSKVTDSEGEWQRVEIINPQSSGMRGVYVRQVGSGVTWSIGDRCVATMKVRVPEGTSFSGIGINIQCVSATSPWIDGAGVVNTNVPSPIDGFTATIVSNPFTIPTGTTQLGFLLRLTGGSGIVEFTEAGIFRMIK